MSGDAQRTLRTNARDLGTTTLARLPRSLSRVCFILINTNRSCRLGIGVTPLMRAIKVSEVFKAFGYDVYYMLNPHCVMFREYVSLLLQRTSEHFFLVYLGQGGEPGPESFIFDDEPLDDEEFIQTITGDRPPGVPVTLMCDFCIPEALFAHIESFDAPTVAIAVTGDEEEFAEAPDVFIDSFCREMTNRNELTNLQLFDSLRIVIKRRGLVLSVASEPADLMREPVAIFNPTVERNKLIR